MSAACAPESDSPVPAALEFQIDGLGPQVVRATLRLSGCETRAWFEHDVTPAVTGNGVLHLDLAALVPANVDFDRGEGGHPPQLIVISAGAPERQGSDPTPETVTAATLVPSRTQLERVVPNPFRGMVRVEYSLARSEDVDVVIYNARGQRVRALRAERQAPGRQTLFWDGTDAHGVPAPAGIYFLRARFGLQVEKRKLVLAR
jgi:hypothetical protein